MTIRYSINNGTMTYALHSFDLHILVADTDDLHSSLLSNNASKPQNPVRSPHDQETGIRYNFNPVKPVRRVLPTFFIYLSASSDTAGRDVRQPKLVGEGTGICLVSILPVLRARTCSAAVHPLPNPTRPTFGQKITELD